MPQVGYSQVQLLTLSFYLLFQDGIVFKDRLANSRRRSDLLGSMRENDHIEYYSTPPNRRRNRSSKELLQSPALIAPDLVATKIVD